VCCVCKGPNAAAGPDIAGRLADNTVLYIAVNFAGMYTKYLTDRGQRKAFLETHRSMETRCRTQKENDRQEKLLLSGECLTASLPSLPQYPLKAGVGHVTDRLKCFSFHSVTEM
jgi:hypothetical protein